MRWLKNGLFWLLALAGFFLVCAGLDVMLSESGRPGENYSGFAAFAAVIGLLLMSPLAVGEILSNREVSRARERATALSGVAGYFACALGLVLSIVGHLELGVLTALGGGAMLAPLVVQAFRTLRERRGAAAPS